MGVMFYELSKLNTGVDSLRASPTHHVNEAAVSEVRTKVWLTFLVPDILLAILMTVAVICYCTGCKNGSYTQMIVYGVLMMIHPIVQLIAWKGFTGLNATRPSAVNWLPYCEFVIGICAIVYAAISLCSGSKPKVQY